MNNLIINVRFGSYHFQVERGGWPWSFRRNAYQAHPATRARPRWRWFKVHQWFDYHAEFDHDAD